MQNLLSVEQLAAFLHKSVASIRSDATRNPQSLPPICRLPGTKRLLWRAEDVDSWLQQYVVKPDFVHAVAIVPRKRGRPRKAGRVLVGATPNEAIQEARHGGC
jgi:predicted DNA-binding transcriptional regulator AlpA